MNDLKWDDFKNFVSTRGLSMQEIVSTESMYYLVASDTNISFSCKIKNHEEFFADYETNFKPKANRSSGNYSAFATKKFGAKSLYKRGHGVQQAVSAGTTDIVFEIPYAWVKITAIEFTNCEALDKVDILILSSSDLVLNQFAFDWNLTKDFYAKKSEYDADLYLGLKIKIIYKSTSAKTVGVNFNFDEVK